MDYYYLCGRASAAGCQVRGCRHHADASSLEQKGPAVPVVTGTPMAMGTGHQHQRGQQQQSAMMALHVQGRRHPSSPPIPVGVPVPSSRATAAPGGRVVHAIDLVDGPPSSGASSRQPQQPRDSGGSPPPMAAPSSLRATPTAPAVTANTRRSAPLAAGDNEEEYVPTPLVHRSTWTPCTSTTTARCTTSVATTCRRAQRSTRRQRSRRRRRAVPHEHLDAHRRR